MNSFSQNYEYYSDEGNHYFHLDQTWESKCYDSDLEDFEDLFKQLGFTPLPVSFYNSLQ